MYYKGIFKELLEDEFLNIKEVNFFSGEYAHFYEAFLKTTNYDMQVYEKQASMFGGRFLNLHVAMVVLGFHLQLKGIMLQESIFQRTCLKYMRISLQKKEQVCEKEFT